MADIILMTGATGFLGTELAARLTWTSQSKIYALVRAAGEAEAYHRLRAAWCHDEELYQSIGTQVLPVPGDFTKPDLGLEERTRRTLEDSVTLVLHAGAEIGFQKSKQELQTANYDGTKNMLSFAAHMRNLRRFVYISTAYVAGRKSGTVLEEEPAGTAFFTLYEESTARAESLVRESLLPFSICRPGMIVGDSRNGWIRSFNTIYYVLKLMLLGRMRILPVRPETSLNIVPGDYVADAVLRISFSEEAVGKTFHLTCPKNKAPLAGELSEYVRTWAKRNLSLALPKPVFLPSPVLKRAGLLYNVSVK